MSSHRRFAAAELKRTSPSPRVVSSESDDDVPEVSYPSQPKVAVPRGDVVETTGDDLRGVLEAEAGGFATFDDDPSGLLGLARRASSDSRPQDLVKSGHQTRTCDHQPVYHHHGP